MPLSVIGALFVCIFITACGPPRPLFGIRAIRVLLSYYIYGDVSRCMYQRPLFGRCPLLGVCPLIETPLYIQYITSILVRSICAFVVIRSSKLVSNIIFRHALQLLLYPDADKIDTQHYIQVLLLPLGPKTYKQS